MITSAQAITVSSRDDKAGNLRYQVDGNVTMVQYNARNLPVWRIEPGGISGQGIDAAKAMSYTYYADGSVATETDQNGNETSNTYDIHGRVLTNEAHIDDFKCSGKTGASGNSSDLKSIRHQNSPLWRGSRVVVLLSGFLCL